MTTRDSKAWWFLMGAAIITAISSRMDILDPLLPAQHTDKAHALIELLSLIVGVASGVMKASPLPLSDEGREKFAQAADREVATKP